MTWAKAAESHALQEEAESESIEEAEAIRSQSPPPSPDSEGGGSDGQFLPELYWAHPIMKVLAEHLGNAGKMNRELTLVSACSGSLAESTVLQAEL